MIDRAIHLASMGFHVFPLIAHGKTPAIKGWQEKATCDVQMVRRTWEAHPDCNIGVVTDRFREDLSLLVVDVDMKDEKDGEQTLGGLGEMPPTLEVLTPTGGRHLYYVVPHAVRQGVESLGPGVDTRSHGGYVVGPGSVTEDGEYEWRMTCRASLTAA